jgi:hypothetical protein
MMKTVLRALFSRRKFTVLAVAAALTLGTASAAFAGSGIGGVFNLGVTNTVDAITKLTGTVAGPSLQIINNSTNAAATALNLQVASGKPPLKVNSTTKVANLNADQLDGLDSSAFGVKTRSSFIWTDTCDTPNTFNECAPVTVTVPAGKTYLVSVWSEFSALGGANNQTAEYCSAVRATGQTQPSCLPPIGGNAPHIVTVWGNAFVTAGSSGESSSLSAGTYTFSTAIRPQAEFGFTNNGKVITKVMVRDASGAAVLPASVSESKAEGTASRER